MTSPSSAASPAETLAASTAILPPNPPDAPLGTVDTSSRHDAVASRSSLDTPGLDSKAEKDILALPSVSADAHRTLSRDWQDGARPVQLLGTARLIAIATVATFTMIMASCGTCVLNIALPTIQVDLGMVESDLQWISSAYSLTYGCFLLLSGRLADIHGRKLVFLAGVFWYALWTLVGPFFKNGAGLVVSRAMTGIGSAMATPSAIGIIAANFHGRSRATAFAVFSAGAPIGGGVGLFLGGLLTTYAPTTWKAALWVTAALTAAIGIAACLVFPADVKTSTDKRVDWVGAATITIGLVLLQFAISSGEGASDGWKTPYIIALLPISVILIAAFFFWEKYVIDKTSRPPLMRLALWTRARGKLAAVYAIGFVSWMGFTSLLYHGTLFYQQVQGLDPIQAMWRFMPIAVSGTLCNALVAFFIARIPTQILICVGIIATGLANVLFALSTPTVSYWKYPFHSMWMCVLGADFLMATGTLFISRLSLPEEQSVAGALFQTLVQLGGSFGLALTTVISTSFQTKALEAGEAAIPAQVKGLHAAFWLGAGCSFAAFGVAVVTLRGMGCIGKTKKQEQPPKEQRDSV